MCHERSQECDGFLVKPTQIRPVWLIEQIIPCRFRLSETFHGRPDEFVHVDLGSGKPWEDEPSSFKNFRMGDSTPHGLFGQCFAINQIWTVPMVETAQRGPVTSWSKALASSHLQETWLGNQQFEGSPDFGRRFRRGQSGSAHRYIDRARKEMNDHCLTLINLICHPHFPIASAAEVGCQWYLRDVPTRDNGSLAVSFRNLATHPCGDVVACRATVH